MKNVKIIMIGFGNVGRAFALLIERKKELLENIYHLNIQITGIATNRHGIACNENGIDLKKALFLVESGQSLSSLSNQPIPVDIPQFIQSVQADVMLENTPVNHHTGQPASSYIRLALEKGMHAITANKGPVAHYYRELGRIAAENGKRFLFESAVMDGAPIFSLFRKTLPLVELRGFRGILNSCTNLLLALMEDGKSLDEAIDYARSIGITETDPSADIDGWDAAIKVCALANVLMDADIRPHQIQRCGIREITPAMASLAKKQGKRWKLVCSAARTEKGVEASVQPELVTTDSPLFSIQGTSSFVQFHTDVLPALGIHEGDPGPETTAYGLLADLIEAVKE